MAGKVHLAMPRTSESLCHHAYLPPDDSRMTTNPEMATCGHCSNHIKENRDWYEQQWAAKPSWEEWSKGLVEGLLSTQRPVLNNLQPIGIEHGSHITDQCHNCGAKILTMCFKGTDWCSEECRKQLEEENAQC